MNWLTALSSLCQGVAVSFGMLTLTLLPLEEVLPGRAVSGVGDTHFVKLRGILSS